MKKDIKKICKQIEKEEDVKILFAIENGSRAWRMESKDSDYDVRFVFVRPLKEYIQIKQPRDVIQKAFDAHLKPCPIEGSLIDVSGFDIFKYIELLSNSNPTTIEWLESDIVYYGTQNKVLKTYIAAHVHYKALYYHYQSLCKNNYYDYIKSQNHVTHKKYLYAFRGLVNAKLVKHKKKIPPIVFTDALEEIKEHLPSNIVTELKKIITLKSQGKEKERITNIGIFDRYIEQFLKEEAAIEEKRSKNLDELNTELRNIVLGEHS